MQRAFATEKKVGSMRRTVTEILKDYERLPEYLGEDILHLNSQSLFGDYPVNIAAVQGRIEDIDVFLEAGANIDQAGEEGFTPLHWAALMGHLDVVKFLTAKGANRLLRNDEGKTPLDIAEILDEKAIVSVLKQVS